MPLRQRQESAAAARLHGPGVSTSPGQVRVPRISEFLGIVVTMYYNDHAPPHFDCWYAGREAQVEIDSLQVLGGSLPAPQLALVRAWAGQYHQELLANWDRARRGVELRRG